MSLFFQELKIFESKFALSEEAVADAAKVAKDKEILVPLTESVSSDCDLLLLQQSFSKCFKLTLDIFPVLSAFCTKLCCKISWNFAKFLGSNAVTPDVNLQPVAANFTIKLHFLTDQPHFFADVHTSKDGRSEKTSDRNRHRLFCRDDHGESNRLFQ